MTKISEVLQIAETTTSCVTLREKLEQWNMSIPDGSSQEVTKEVTKKHLAPIIENINKLITDSSVIQHSNSLTNLKEAAAFLITIIERKIHNLTQASTIAAYQAYIDRLNNVIIKEIDDRIAELASPSPMAPRGSVSPLSDDSSSPRSDDGSGSGSDEEDKEEIESADDAEQAAERLRKETEAKEAAETERLRKEAEAREAAETERLRKEAEAREAAETERLRKEAEAKEAAETERLRKEAEARKAAEAERLRKETEARKAAEAERLRNETEAREAAEAERLRKEAADAERKARESKIPRYDFTKIRSAYNNDNLNKEYGAKTARTLDVLVESLVNLHNQKVTIEHNGVHHDLMQLILNHDASQFKATQPRTLENKILCRSLVHFHPDRSSASNRATKEDQNEITAFITDLTSAQPNQKTLDKFKVLQKILQFVKDNGETACLSTRQAPSAAIVPAFSKALATTGMSAQQLEKDLTDRFIKAIEKHLQKEAVLLGKFHKHLNIVQQQIKQDLMYPTAALMDIAPLVRLNHVSNKFRDMLKGYLVTKTFFERDKFQGNIDTLAATYGQILRANDTIQKARIGKVVVVSRDHGAEIVLQGGASVVAHAISDPTSAENIGIDNQEARNIIRKRAFKC